MPRCPGLSLIHICVVVDELAVELHAERGGAGDACLLCLEKRELRTAESLAGGVEHAGDQRGQQLDGLGGLNDGDVYEAIVHAAVGE